MNSPDAVCASAARSSSRLAISPRCATGMSPTYVDLVLSFTGAAVPLSQLAAVNVDESTAEAIGDWHYWVAQVYRF